MEFKIEAVKVLADGKFMSCDADGVVEWKEDAVDVPTEAEILAKAEELEAEWNANEYQRLRKAEYDKLNQLELMYDDKVNGTDTWGEAINAIKAKYPKPE